MTKRIIALLAVSMLLAGCSQTPEEKAKAIITKAINDELDDPSTYEPIEFGALDSAITSLDNHREYVLMVDLVKVLVEKSETHLNLAKMYQGISQYSFDDEMRQGRELLDSVHHIEARLDAIKAAFKPEFVGWKMTHSFRAKQAGEDKKKYDEVYYLDKELTKVVPPPVVD